MGRRREAGGKTRGSWRRNERNNKTKAETCKKTKQDGARKVLEALAELRCECLLGTFPRGTALYAPSKSNKGCN